MSPEFTLVNPSPEVKAVIAARGKFAAEYCQAKGWDIKNLDVLQLLEIRSQDGWKEAK